MNKSRLLGVFNSIRCLSIVTAIPALISLFIASGLQAATVTYAFSGSLTQVDADLQPTFSLNDMFSGTITLDDSVTDTNPNPIIGVYRDAGIGTVTVANLTYTFTNKDVLFTDNIGTPPDYFSMGGGDNGNEQILGPNVEGFSVADTFISLGDDTDLDFIVGDAFQEINIDLADTDRRTFFISFGSGNKQVFGTLSTFSPIPIPAAVWLFGSGLLGLLGVARRNKWEKK